MEPLTTPEFPAERKRGGCAGLVSGYSVLMLRLVEACRSRSFEDIGVTKLELGNEGDNLPLSSPASGEELSGDDGTAVSMGRRRGYGERNG